MAPLGPPKLEVCPDDEFLEQEREEQEAAAAAAAAAARARLQRQQVMKGAGGAAAAAAAAGRGPGLRPMPLAPVDAALAALPPLVVPVLGSAALNAAPSGGGKVAGGSGGSSSSAAAGGGVLGGYDERLLVGPDGREQCFEEARAAAWLARQPAWKVQQDLPTQQQQEDAQQVLKQEVQQQPQQQQQQLQQQQQQEEEQQQVLQQEAPQRHKRSAELAPAAATAQPAVPAADLASQVVAGAVGANADAALPGDAATRSAGPSTGVATALCDQQEQQQEQQQQEEQQYQQQNEQPYHQQQQLQERRRRTSRLSMGPLAGAGVGAEPTMTMSTKAALASLNRMFNSDFTASVAPSPHVARGGRMSMAAGRPGDGGGGGWGGGAEPTATIQTREALSLVNDLFCDEAPGAAGDLTQVRGSVCVCVCVWAAGGAQVFDACADVVAITARRLTWQNRVQG
jgi:hypothetical protein